MHDAGCDFPDCVLLFAHASSDFNHTISQLPWFWITVVVHLRFHKQANVTC